MLQRAAQEIQADLVLIDAGSDLGSISRATLIATQQVVLPLGPSLFSLQALRSLGPVLRNWRKGWQERLDKLSVESTTTFPTNPMQILGYVVMRHGTYSSRLAINFNRWFFEIPEIYYSAVLDEPENKLIDVNEDPHNLFVFNYHDVLLPIAIEEHKPMFALKLLGSLKNAASQCHKDFRNLAQRLVLEQVLL
jgi:hypothetical protein